MTVGFIMMCHTAFDRAAQVARYWGSHGAPVVIHVDARVSQHDYAALGRSLADLSNVSFSKRQKCEWGTWSLVAAAQAGAEQMLDRHPEVQHVFLASGSCLPLRPVDELNDYLAARPQTDFIESVTTAEVGWTVGGIDMERFTLRFPFSWKKQRRLFDRYVRLQRRLGVKRRIPGGIVPHLGSQWWCLSRRTLSAILQDPDRPTYDRYFSRVWIPDESYFQSLARLYSSNIESRSLTLSKFDYQGKPHIFYDDHLQLLRRSDCFVARKIWPKADKLYANFLSERPAESIAEPNPSKIDRLFSKAVERRTKGRPGLYMQSRFPRQDHENGKTSAHYSIFQGFSDLFENFEGWLAKYVGARVHGHLFGPERAEFAGREPMFNGCIPDSATLRDYNPRAFLTNLIWNGRGERQCFMFSPRDTQDINWFTATDPNAQISVISGAWAVPLFHSNMNFLEIRREAARLQQIEVDHLNILRSMYVKARVRIWNMAEFIENPMEPLQTIIDEISPRATRRLTEAPQMVDLTGFGQFLQNLRNQGMQPRLMGDFPVYGDLLTQPPRRGRPYLVK
ncbi:core-2/I-Branching enzyme [Rhodobacter aestuarii]|uniref:Peptide O-xylosyltransferase n=1 Tax=Rhodobacter aestuarii TaxID=453582 RepID=A0A1N7QEN4_9RHOB|nr:MULTISPECIES: beta-1,6-N-acetylglucosaminyltransferase [Rhodobacter]PTV93518.1 core-2/I-Branching enzyme [Rhodobacter aestuarii]SIT21341.1 Core-2/I-Branching enzyme [Rhodobacter aestuarii]SOC08437.1 core-2/I-Branching enzyme [Rhodobacter sp. JA431]